jgi:hypothetical protein
MPAARAAGTSQRAAAWLLSSGPPARFVKIRSPGALSRGQGGERHVFAPLGQEADGPLARAGLGRADPAPVDRLADRDRSGAEIAAPEPQDLPGPEPGGDRHADGGERLGGDEAGGLHEAGGLVVRQDPTLGPRRAPVVAHEIPEPPVVQRVRRQEPVAAGLGEGVAERDQDAADVAARGALGQKRQDQPAADVSRGELGQGDVPDPLGDDAGVAAGRR